MDILASYLQSFFSSIGPFFILLGLLIFVHELGHFLVAKFFGVRVEVFSLGFGKKIAQYVKGDTTYCLSVVPLGGYVKMYGDDPTKEVPDEEKKHAFLCKPVSQRIAIVLAGPLMNFFFAALLFTLIGLIGQKVPDSTIGDVAVESEAHKLGFRSGDKIVAVNGEETITWKSFSDILEASGKTPLKIKIQRTLSANQKEDKATPTEEILEVTPTLVKNPNVLSDKEWVGSVEGLSLASTAPIYGVSSPKSLAGTIGFPNVTLISKINDQEISYLREVAPVLFSLKESGKAAKITFKHYDYEEKKESKEQTLEIDSQAWSQLAAGTTSDSIMKELGFLDSQLFLLVVKDGSPAFKSGLKKGDRLISLNGKELNKWDQVVEIVKSYKKDDGPIQFEIERAGEVQSLSITPKMTELLNSQGQDDHRFTVGIVPAMAMVTGPQTLVQFTNPFKAVAFGFEKTMEWSKLVAISFIRLFQGRVSTRNIGGIITIGKVAGDSFRAGLDRYLTMMAIISVNLFLLNLLPIPILDGGHLVFFSIEALRGAPLSLRKMEIAQQIGLVLLISLMAMSLFNDITNLFSPW